MTYFKGFLILLFVIIFCYLVHFCFCLLKSLFLKLTKRRPDPLPAKLKHTQNIEAANSNLSPNQTHKKIRNKLATQDKIIAENIKSLSEANGCPCNSKPFVYWVGKINENRRDFLQSRIIHIILNELKLFAKVPEPRQLDAPLRYTEPGFLIYLHSYSCPNCESIWEFFSHEWRMMASEHCLRRLDIGDPSDLYPNLCSNTGTSRSGKQWDVPDQTVLNFEQVQQFLLSGTYH